MESCVRRMDIRAQIDLVSVPVFAIDSCRDGSFRIAAINRAHAKLTGLDPEAVVGKTPHEILPSPAAARAVVRNYRRAMTTDGPISYRETLPFGDQLLTFDTTLQRQSYGARNRLIGTALKVEMTGDVLADLQFYVALARNAVSTIAELAKGQGITTALSQKEREAAAILSRQALQSMSDIEKSMSRAHRQPTVGCSETSSSIRRVLLEG